MADVVESYLGALTLDQGLEAAEHFLQVHLFPTLSVSSAPVLISNSYCVTASEIIASPLALKIIVAKSLQYGSIFRSCKLFRVVLLELLLIIIDRAVYILERFLTANLFCQVLMTTEYNNHQCSVQSQKN